MSNKHSPGPWRQEDGRVYGPNPDLVGEEVLICDTAPANVSLTEYDEANANLMAVAPELLAELKRLNKILIKDYKIRGVDVPARHRLDKVTRVIDRAEGG